VWKAVLKGAFCIPMDDGEIKLFRGVAGAIRPSGAKCPASISGLACSTSSRAFGLSGFKAATCALKPLVVFGNLGQRLGQLVVGNASC
jgi:hypothetical protein